MIYRCVEVDSLCATVKKINLGKRYQPCCEFNENLAFSEQVLHSVGEAFADNLAEFKVNQHCLPHFQI